MDITKAVAKLRLRYHLNMIDFVNIAYQLKLMGGEEADLKNKNHLKQVFDCYERLGYRLPPEIRNFKNS